MSLPRDSLMLLASVVAEPWEIEEAVERQRDSSGRAWRAGVGDVLGEGDSQRSLGGLSSGADAMVSVFFWSGWLVWECVVVATEVHLHLSVTPISFSTPSKMSSFFTFFKLASFVFCIMMMMVDG